MRFKGFVGPAYIKASLNVECQKCVNLYPEMNEIGTGKEGEIAALMSTPGILTWITLPTSPVRAVYTASNGMMYAVGGNKCYRITDTPAAVLLGTLASSTGYVSFSDNGIAVVLTDGPTGYSIDIVTDVFTSSTFPSFPGATTLGYLDAYILGNIPNSGRFFWTNLNSVTIDPLDFATAEGLPDNMIALYVNNQEAWLFGAKTTEVFYDCGDANQPFVRRNGAVMEYGLSAPFGVAKLNNTLYWPAQNENGQGIVVAASGYQPSRVSNHGIETAMHGKDLSTARAWAYQEAGHGFYVLNFADETWAYDVSTSQWHQRSSLGSGVEHRIRADCHCFAYGKHLVGDYITGVIYEQSLAFLSDSVGSSPKTRSSPHISNEMNRIFYHKFQLDMEIGVGLAVGLGSDPQVALSWSDDGGHTWSAERWRSGGLIGDYKRRVIWNQLGSARDRVFKIRITDPVKVVILGADLEFTVGTS